MRAPTHACMHPRLHGQCCLDVMSELDNFHGLRLHIGVGVGEVLFLHVGGVMDRWYRSSGAAVAQSHRRHSSKSRK